MPEKIRREVLVSSGKNNHNATLMQINMCFSNTISNHIHANSKSPENAPKLDAFFLRGEENDVKRKSLEKKLRKEKQFMAVVQTKISISFTLPN